MKKLDHQKLLQTLKSAFCGRLKARYLACVRLRTPKKCSICQPDMPDDGIYMTKREQGESSLPHPEHNQREGNVKYTTGDAKVALNYLIELSAMRFRHYVSTWNIRGKIVVHLS